MKVIDLQADAALKEQPSGTDPAGLATAQFPHEATDSRRAGFKSSTPRGETESVIFN